MFSVCPHLGGGVTQPTQPSGGCQSADSAGEGGVSQLTQPAGSQSTRGVSRGGWVSRGGSAGEGQPGGVSQGGSAGGGQPR